MKKTGQAVTDDAKIEQFTNPFKPGAGHMPPFLAGRQAEQVEFKRLLAQSVILENMILTGLRGLGKTVLLEHFKPLAIAEGWLWVGADLTESVSVSEEILATRLLTDLSVVTSGISMTIDDRQRAGFTATQKEITWNYATLRKMYDETPGLVSDKLKHVLENIWSILARLNKKGIIFAYDEAQNLSDAADNQQYPLSLLLDLFQSIQRKGVTFMLVLTGLPTLFPKLVETRTYTERLFRVVTLDRLSEEDTRSAILKPVEEAHCPVQFTEESVKTICTISGGYPYFVQFICKEVYDRWVQQMAAGGKATVPTNEIIMKLDTDFFAGRWARVTDRQRDLLRVIAAMSNSDGEFTVQEIVTASEYTQFMIPRAPFKSSRVSAILAALMEVGLIYRNRHGKYRFAVPMFGQFILRHSETQ